LFGLVVTTLLLLSSAYQSNDKTTVQLKIKPINLAQVCHLDSVKKGARVALGILALSFLSSAKNLKFGPTVVAGLTTTPTWT
jgi:hypothetical protein